MGLQLSTVIPLHASAKEAYWDFPVGVPTIPLNVKISQTLNLNLKPTCQCLTKPTLLNQTLDPRHHIRNPSCGDLNERLKRTSPRAMACTAPGRLALALLLVEGFGLINSLVRITEVYGDLLNLL